MKNRNNIGFEVLRRRILLKGTISLQTGLHIGTGRDIGASAIDNPILKDFLGKPFIPGSSLKGVLRSNLEAFLRAYNDRECSNLCCEVVGNKKPCISKNADELKFLIAILQVLKEKGHLSQKEIEDEMSQRGWKEDRIKEAGEYPKLLKRACEEGIISITDKGKYKFQKDAPSLDELIWKYSCWICKLFGSSWIASKVQVMDMDVCREWMPEMLSQRDGVVIDRESETAVPKLLFQYEAVPAGTEFNFEILVENPEDYELGLLMLGFELFNKGFAHLGGDTSRGLGRIKINLSDIIELDPDSVMKQLEASLESPSKSETEEEEKEEEKVIAEPSTSDKATDSLMEAVKSCVQQAGRLNFDDLVKAMQDRGWNKDKLREAEYRNYRALFNKAVELGILITEGKFYKLAESQSDQKSEEKIETEEQPTEKQKEILEKTKIWYRALWQELQKVIKSNNISMEER